MWIDGLKKQENSEITVLESNAHILAGIHRILLLH